MICDNRVLSPLADYILLVPEHWKLAHFDFEIRVIYCWLAASNIIKWGLINGANLYLRVYMLFKRKNTYAIIPM